MNKLETIKIELHMYRLPYQYKVEHLSVHLNRTKKFLVIMLAFIVVVQGL